MATRPVTRWQAGLAILASIGLFGASLTAEVVRYERTTVDGWMALSTGWIGLLAWHVGWYANPLLVVSLFSPVASRRGVAVLFLVVALVALGLGLTSFVTLGRDDAMFGRHEGEGSGAFAGFGPGIFLWTASLVCSAVASALTVARLRDGSS